jgi:S1-C subfamily serine protease
MTRVIPTAAKRLRERKSRPPAAWYLVPLLLVLVLAVTGCVEEADRDTATETTEQAPEVTGTTEAAPADEPGDNDQAVTPEGDPARSPARRVADALRPSVVQVSVGEGQNQAGQGSGVIYSSDGLIVTNDHVLTAGGGEPAQSIRVTLATGRTYDAEIVGRDPRTDLALIRIPASGLPEAPFREDLADVAPGDYAIAIGNPLGFEGSVTMGIISGIERELRFSNLFTDLIQTDAAISPGNSGGALADVEGQVIGINVAAISPATRAQGIGFAIPSDLVITVVEQLAENGRVEYAFLGIQAISIDPFLRQHLEVEASEGVLVGDVGEGTPAAQAGLQEGDVIAEFDGEELNGASDLFRLLRERRPGDQVTLTVLRGGETLEIQATLGEAPEP